jgi:hypothetical protein
MAAFGSGFPSPFGAPPTATPQAQPDAFAKPFAVPRPEGGPEDDDEDEWEYEYSTTETEVCRLFSCHLSRELIAGTIDVLRDSRPHGPISPTRAQRCDKSWTYQ